MKNCKISVIVPVYNAAQYLKEAIEDLKHQTLSDFEMIFVNDGSSDESLHILEAFRKQDLRTRIINQENQGAGPARNAGMQNALGEYLLFLDADDRYDKGLLERSYMKAKEIDADIVIFQGDTFDCISGKKSEAPWLLNVNEYEKYIFENGVVNLTHKNDIVYKLTNSTVWNKLFKVSFVKENHFQFQRIYGADSLYFVMMTLACADRIAVLQEKLIHYRKDNPTGQIMNQDKNPLGVYKALCAVRELLIQKNIYELLHKSYVNYALESCFTRFHFFRSLHSEKLLYDTLHNGGLEKLGLIHAESMIEKQYLQDFYVKIKKTSYEEYRFELDERRYMCGLSTSDMYAMPDFSIPHASKIVLYGAGNVGKSYFTQLMNIGKYRVIGWVDKQYDICGYPIEAPEKIIGIDCEAVIISVLKENTANSIIEYLKNMGVAENMIYWKKPIKV